MDADFVWSLLTRNEGGKLCRDAAVCKNLDSPERCVEPGSARDEVEELAGMANGFASDKKGESGLSDRSSTAAPAWRWAITQFKLMKRNRGVFATSVFSSIAATTCYRQVQLRCWPLKGSRIVFLSKLPTLRRIGLLVGWWR